jgi:rare lipoprotein A
MAAGRAAGADHAPAGGLDTTLGPAGLPIAAPATPSPDVAAGDDPARGLPADLLAGGLPGKAPVDAATGQPIDSRPAPGGPDVTRAEPGLGLLGPSNGAPLPSTLPTFSAIAGWYGPEADGRRTASGELYDPAAYSAASRTLRFGTLLRIGYAGRVVTVRVNDRGPYVKSRDLDLSRAAAAALGLPGPSVVTAQVLPLSG